MAERPTDGFPRFATNDITLPDGTNNKVPLRNSVENNGYGLNEQPPVQEWNYILDKFNRWIEYLDEAAGTDASTAWPVGSYYFSNSTTNPATTLGFGTWARQAEGRFVVGVGQGTDSNSNTRTFQSGNNGGEYEVTLTEQQMPRHDHRYSRLDASDISGGGTTGDGTSGEIISELSEEIGRAHV